MALEAIFLISGFLVFSLPVAKRLGEGRKRSFFIFRIISKGDEGIRDIYHSIVHLYTEWKERMTLILNKKIYMYSRNLLNKLSAYVENKRVEYINNMRDAKLLRKNEGFSEFYKNISNVDKGNGEIYEDFEVISQNEE